jgi:hypothetical protein
MQFFTLRTCTVIKVQNEIRAWIVRIWELKISTGMNFGALEIEKFIISPLYLEHFCDKTGDLLNTRLVYYTLDHSSKALASPSLTACYESVCRNEWVQYPQPALQPQWRILHYVITQTDRHHNAQSYIGKRQIRCHLFINQYQWLGLNLDTRLVCYTLENKVALLQLGSNLEHYDYFGNTTSFMEYESWLWGVHRSECCTSHSHSSCPIKLAANPSQGYSQAITKVRCRILVTVSTIKL